MNGLIAGALGGVGQGMVSIAKDRDEQDMAKLRSELEWQKQKMAADYAQTLKAADRSRVSGMIGGVSREVDDPTHPEGKRKRTDVEYNRAVAEELGKNAEFESMGNFSKVADRFEDNDTKAKELVRKSERDAADDAFRNRQLEILDSQRRDLASMRQAGRVSGGAEKMDEATKLQAQSYMKEAAKIEDQIKSIDSSRHKAISENSMTPENAALLDREKADLHRRLRQTSMSLNFLFEGGDADAVAMQAVASAQEKAKQDPAAGMRDLGETMQEVDAMYAPAIAAKIKAAIKKTGALEALGGKVKLPTAQQQQQPTGQQGIIGRAAWRNWNNVTDEGRAQRTWLNANAG